MTDRQLGFAVIGIQGNDLVDCEGFKLSDIVEAALDDRVGAVGRGEAGLGVDEPGSAEGQRRGGTDQHVSIERNVGRHFPEKGGEDLARDGRGGDGGEALLGLVVKAQAALDRVGFDGDVEAEEHGRPGLQRIRGIEAVGKAFEGEGGFSRSRVLCQEEVGASGEQDEEQGVEAGETTKQGFHGDGEKGKGGRGRQETTRHLDQDV